MFGKSRDSYCYSVFQADAAAAASEARDGAHDPFFCTFLQLFPSAVRDWEFPPKKKTPRLKNIAKSFSRIEFHPRTFFLSKMHSLYWHTPLCRISEHAHIFWALSCTFVQGNQIIKFRFASKVLNGENARSVLLLFASPSHRLSAW